MVPVEVSFMFCRQNVPDWTFGHVILFHGCIVGTEYVMKRTELNRDYLSKKFDPFAVAVTKDTTTATCNTNTVYNSQRKTKLYNE